MYSRRQFVTGASAFTAASVFAPQAMAQGLFGTRSVPLLGEASFRDDVASGDPTDTGITLWTRLYGVDQRGSVKLEVAKDSGFSNIIAKDTIGTSSASGYSVKARVEQLEPRTEYFYRFATKNGSSRVGRFRTMPPADSNETIKFAYCSCQDFGHGYYTAYKVMADEDIDFVAFLGDFIYAEDDDEIYFPPLSGPKQVRDDVSGNAKTLSDFRRKYHVYRSDGNLRRVQRNFPFVYIWDDHEVWNDYTGGSKTWSSGKLGRQKKAGQKAFFENQPIYPVGNQKGNRIYRSLTFGKNLELIMLDERTYRDEQPCNNSIAGTCTTLNDDRKFLGSDQMDFVKGRLQNSSATWKLIGNQVMIMETKFGDDYLTLDPWQGYQKERNELLDFMKSNNIQDTHFITGDIHTFLAGQVQTSDGTPVALEFVGGSITSACLGELTIELDNGTIIIGNDDNPQTSPYIVDTLKSYNPHIKAADLDHHGYATVEVTADKLNVAYKRMKTIKDKNVTARLPDLFWTVERGQTTLPYS